MMKKTELPYSSNKSSSSFRLGSGIVPVGPSTELAGFRMVMPLPRLAISLDHMHPLSPVHFSSFHSLLAFSTFVSVSPKQRAINLITHRSQDFAQADNWLAKLVGGCRFALTIPMFQLFNTAEIE